MSETVTTDLSTQIADSALIYLSLGPAPWSEVIRVLSQHLDARPTQVDAELHVLVGAGRLVARGYQVSLPAGGDVRDTEEQK